MHAVRSLRRYNISPCILVYPSMLSPEDRSEPISCFPPFEVIDQTLRFSRLRVTRLGISPTALEPRLIPCWSKEEPPGSYVASGFQRQKEVRTSVQPRAHRGHYNFKEPPGSKQRSLDPNLRVPTRPQRPKYNFRKKDRTPVQPRAHRGHYIPKEPSGSHTNSGSKYTRVPIRSPNLKKKLCTFVRPQGPITITETSGFQPTISGSVIESPGSYTASGLRSRSQDLE
ncbi:hypothetical protein F2Q70_00002865 [Brassica cretica]|uniref:Uncharacterized protein n=1 Tax=Brassica cretica TaxID=69181 RepID=A0A8S9IK19_BRACR|nr:hypothetical protein F2Q70_00002865 [Brassica cretica]